MSINAEFTIARLEIKVKTLKKQVVEKQNALIDALNQVNDLTTENETLKRKLKKHETPAKRYDYNWSWISKIVFLVSQANKPLRLPKL